MHTTSGLCHLINIFMKHVMVLFLTAFMALGSYAQIPSLPVTDTSGNVSDLTDILQNGTNYGIVIWSAQDPQSIAALDDHNNYYSLWNNTYNVEFLILNIDDAVPHQDIIDYADSHSWTYELYFASSTETLQEFQIDQTPYIYLVNTDQEIVFETAGWPQGSLLNDEIIQLFPVGLEAIETSHKISAFSNEDILFLNFEKGYENISIELFSVNGKRFLERSFDFVSPGDKMLQLGNGSNEKIFTLVIRNSLDILLSKNIYIDSN